MIFCVDFDGTLVDDGHAYDDLETPLRLLPGAREALSALKRAGHVLVLYSGRANRALLFNPDLDPLVRAGIRRVDSARWRERRDLHEARYWQMVRFVQAELAGLIDAIDDGFQGKPSADLFIDDRALAYGEGRGQAGWNRIARTYGDPEVSTSSAPLLDSES